MDGAYAYYVLPAGVVPVLVMAIFRAHGTIYRTDSARNTSARPLPAAASDAVDSHGRLLVAEKTGATDTSLCGDQP